MRRIFYLLGLLIISNNLAYGATQLKDEGSSQGYINVIDCVGAGITCSKSGITGTMTVGGGGGGGDAVSIDGVAVVDPDFVSTGQIDFVDTSNTVTANINDNSILEVDLKAVDAAVDEDILTYESTTGDYEWHTPAELSLQPLEATLTDIADGTIAENLVNTANPWADNEVADDVTAGNVEGTDLGTLTDGKACTYDLTGTEIDCASDFQPLEATLTDIADGTIAEDLVNTANPWADNEVADTITAGNVEGTDLGTLIDTKFCTYDLAGTEIDCTSDGGSGAPTDADYLVGTANGSLSAEIVVGTSPGGELGGTWASPTLDDSVTTTGWVMGTFSGTTLTAGTVNIDLLDGVGAVDMDYGSADITDHTFTTDGTGTAEFVIPAGGIDSTEILDDTLLEVDLKAVDAAVDEECLTYESTTGDFEWQTCGSGADTNAVKEYWWPASATLPLEAADVIPPIAKDTGTNVDQLAVDFDSAADECRSVTFKVPSDVQSGSTITFRAYWYSTATSGDVIWDFRHTSGDTEGETWDDTLTTEAAAADTVGGTTKFLTFTVWTETLANTGWAANDLVTAVFCRDANAAGDTMAADARAIGFGVEIPRA